MIIFYKFFWNDLYYNTKWGIKNLFTYFKIVWRMRPWDFDNSILSMTRFQLQILLKTIEKGHEVDEDRLPKEKDIKRCLELMTNIINDDAIERLGGLNCSKYPFEFKECEKELSGDQKMYELVEFRSEQEMEEDSQKTEDSFKLEQDEWHELWSIISKGKHSNHGAQGWWD